jgi:hypothetical protein
MIDIGRPAALQHEYQIQVVSGVRVRQQPPLLLRISSRLLQKVEELLAAYPAPWTNRCLMPVVDVCSVLTKFKSMYCYCVLFWGYNRGHVLKFYFKKYSQCCIYIKYIVGRKLRWVMSGINCQLLLYCLGADILFLNLKEHHSLK